MKKTIIGANILLVLLSCDSASADERLLNRDEIQDDEIVVTATMTEKIMTDTPGAVEVISRRELMEMNAETLADALVDATGLVVTTETGRMKCPSIRGTGNKHTLVLLDGRRITSGFKDLTGIEQIPVDIIERIEVVRGPASALYGSDAIGGVINVITRKPSDTLTAGTTLQYGQSTYGEGDESAARAHVSSTVARFGYFMSGSYRHKDGYDRDGVTPDDGDDIDMASVAGRFSFDITETQALMAGFETVDRDFEGLRDLMNQDRTRSMDERRLNYFLEYNGKITDSASVMLRANRSEHENDVEVDPPTNAVPGTIGDESHAERALNQLEGRVTGMVGKRHLLTFGTEFVEESREDDAGLDDNFETFSLYAQDEYKIMDPLYLVFSIRWIDNSDYGSEWTPRAALTYALMDHLRLKGSYGKGFRSPDFLELFVPTYMKQGKLIYEPNDELEAESSETYEAGIEGEYKDFRGRLTWFKNSIEDMIEPVYYMSSGSGKQKKDYYQYQNIAEATMTGIEFEWGLDLPAGFDLSGNLAYLETENESTGKDLEGRPDYKGSVRLGYRHLPLGIHANLRLTYIGERYYADENEDPVTTVGAYLSKKITRIVKIFAGADNLFNAGEDSGVEPTFFYGGVTLTY